MTGRARSTLRRRDGRTPLIRAAADAAVSIAQPHRPPKPLPGRAVAASSSPETLYRRPQDTCERLMIELRQTVKSAYRRRENPCSCGFGRTPWPAFQVKPR